MDKATLARIVRHAAGTCSRLAEDAAENLRSKEDADDWLRDYEVLAATQEGLEGVAPEEAALILACMADINCVAIQIIEDWK